MNYENALKLSSDQVSYLLLDVLKDKKLCDSIIDASLNLLKCNVENDDELQKRKVAVLDALKLISKKIDFRNEKTLIINVIHTWYLHLGEKCIEDRTVNTRLRELTSIYFDGWNMLMNADHKVRVDKLTSNFMVKSEGISTERNQYMEMFESLPLSVFILDENGDLDLLNLRAVEFYNKLLELQSFNDYDNNLLKFLNVNGFCDDLNKVVYNGTLPEFENAYFELNKNSWNYNNKKGYILIIYVHK